MRVFDIFCSVITVIVSLVTMRFSQTSFRLGLESLSCSWSSDLGPGHEGSVTCLSWHSSV